MKALDKLIKARTGLILDQIFFGSLALRLEIKEDRGCETAWTNGVVLGYDPEFIDSLSLAKCKALWAHEAMHIVTLHNLRRQGRDKDKWNMAGDYAINDTLIEAGFDLPDGALTGYGTDGYTEKIYNMLPDPDPNGDKGNDPGGCGEVRDHPCDQSSPAEMSQVEQEIKVAVAQAAQQAKGTGELPGGLGRLVEEMLNPIIDWREILRRFVQTNAKNDYSWSPPNRRFVHLGLYLPSLRSEELGDVVIAVDTSGSISTHVISQFAAEISGILEEYDTTATVVYCDTKVTNVETFNKNDLPLELHPKGGGGTDFRPPFEWVDTHGLAPACLIYLTDLRCHTYPDAPGYPVLWAQLGSRGMSPPFGEVVNVE